MRTKKKLLITLTIAGLILCLSVVASFFLRALGKRDCPSRLTVLDHVLWRYGEDNAGAHLERLDDAVPRIITAKAAEEIFVCPKAKGSPAQRRYVLVPRKGQPPTPDTMIAHCPSPAHRGRRWVLFWAGRLELVPEKEFLRLVRSSQQGRRPSDPASPPPVVDTGRGGA